MMVTEPVGHSHGVQAPSDAGTPSPLPGGGSATALDTLEFDRALRAVAGFAVGPLGAARIIARRPTADLAWIREELAAVEEVAVLLRREAPLVVEPAPDAATALARPRGSAPGDPRVRCRAR